MTRKVDGYVHIDYTITLSFEDDGLIDHLKVEALVAEALDHAMLEGVLTPDDEGHATLASLCIMER